MTTFVAVHGAWSGGWAWRKMKPLLSRRGHELVAPTLTGIGERAHLASPACGLAMHVADVAAVLEYEDLSDVVLIGHSYGGMVVTQVAGLCRARIAKLVYLDAFVPRDGQCVFDLLPPDLAQRMRERAASEGDGWRLPPNPVPPDTPLEDREWIERRRGFQPLATHTERCSLDPEMSWPPRAYIYCTRVGPVDVFRPFADQAKRSPDWSSAELDASHSPHITAPNALADLLTAVAR